MFTKPTVEEFKQIKVKILANKASEFKKHISDIYSNYRNCINENLHNGKTKFSCHARNHTDENTLYKMPNIIKEVLSEYSEYKIKVDLFYDTHYRRDDYSGMDDT